MKVRDLLRLPGRDGWLVVHHRGSHRRLKHPTKPGRVTVSGHQRYRSAFGDLRIEP
jgi:predicted RNA binding protein YcfA (HicA-like mRNA interferase family)